MFNAKHISTRVAEMLSTLVLLGATQNAFSAVVTNGGFETGDFTGWSATGNVAVRQFNPSNPCCAPSEGVYLAQFNAGDRPPNGHLSQTFTTIEGNKYILEFDFAKGGPGSGTASINVQVMGLSSLLNDVINDNSGGRPGAYTSYSYSFIADDTNSTLIFSDVTVGTISFDALLDNVSVNTVPVPVPAAAWMLGPSLLVLFGMSRKNFYLKKECV